MGSPASKTERRTLSGGIVLLSVALLSTGCGSRLEGPGLAAQAPATGPTAPASGAVAPGPIDAGAAGAAGPAAAAPGPAAPGTIDSPAGAAAGSTTGTAGTTSGSGTATGAGTAEKRNGTNPGTVQTATAGGAFANQPGTSPGGPPIDIKGADSQGVTASTIKIGAIAPLSGAAGFLGEAEIGAIRAYTSLANAKGGVKGRTFSLVVADSQFDPVLEAQAARKLVDQDKVFALFNVLGDSSGPFVTSRGIPTMVFGLTPPAFSSRYSTTHVTGFSTMDSVSRMAYSLKVLQKRPINSTAILYDSSNVVLTPWVKYLAAAWNALGVEVKSADSFNVSDGDCTSLVLKVQNLKIDFWQLAQSLAWPACAAAMGRQGWKPPQGFGGPYTADEKFIAQGGAVGMDGVYGQQVGVQIIQSYGQPYTYGGQIKGNVAPLVDEYVESMKKYSPNSADPDTLESIWAQSFWTAAQALVKAIDVQSSAITWKGVNQWFASQKSYRSGLIAPINFDPNCKTGSPTWLYQWKFDKTKNKFEQTPWKDQGGPFSLPESFLNKILPGGGKCYLTKAADAEL